MNTDTLFIHYGGKDEIPEGTWRSPTIDTYDTADRQDAFTFSFETQTDGSVRAYILNMPSYGSRNTGLHSTHRLTSGARYYVCREPAVYSVADARIVAGRWAERTQRYIRTGATFEQQMARP